MHKIKTDYTLKKFATFKSCKLFVCKTENYPCILKLFLIPNAKTSKWSYGASNL